MYSDLKHKKNNMLPCIFTDCISATRFVMLKQNIFYLPRFNLAIGRVYIHFYKCFFFFRNILVNCFEGDQITCSRRVFLEEIPYRTKDYCHKYLCSKAFTDDILLLKETLERVLRIAFPDKKRKTKSLGFVFF